jgi:hypothetical protein
MLRVFISSLSTTTQGEALISEVYLSARQLIVLLLLLVLELGASAETLTHRKPNYVPFVPEPNFSAIENEDEFESEDEF